MRGKRSSRRYLLLALMLIACAAAASHALWLPALGWFLVDAEPPRKADMVLLLAGDGYGRRLTRAAELVRQNYAPRVLVSGPTGFYLSHESDLAIAYAVANGHPAEWFIPFEHEATSTEEEAHAVLPELRRRGVRSFLLVTSDYHTRRAGGIFRRYLKDMEMTVVAAPDYYFDPNTWWKTRPARKILLLEWIKTVTSWVGI